MSPLTAMNPRVDVSETERQQLEKLCVSIRGKLQFMDYLVRAALADVDRFHDESDAGTRIFIRQLIDMHMTNLASESDAMTLVGEFCHAIESTLNQEPAGSAGTSGDVA